MRQGLKRLPKKVVADAAYGSEENYVYPETHQVENYLKYNTFYQDTHRKTDILREHQFRSEHFEYDPDKHQFVSPAKRRLSYLFTRQSKTDNCSESTRRHYAVKAARIVLSKANVPKPKATDNMRKLAG